MRRLRACWSLQPLAGCSPAEAGLVCSPSRPHQQAISYLHSKWQVYFRKEAALKKARQLFGIPGYRTRKKNTSNVRQPPPAGDSGDVQLSWIYNHFTDIWAQRENLLGFFEHCRWSKPPPGHLWRTPDVLAHMMSGRFTWVADNSRWRNSINWIINDSSINTTRCNNYLTSTLLCFDYLIKMYIVKN